MAGSRNRISIIFILILAAVMALSIFAVVFSIFTFREHGADQPEHTIRDVSDDWFSIDGDGMYNEFSSFNERLDQNEVVLSRIFIFDRDYRVNTLTFSVDNCAVEVYQDGVLIHAQGSIEDVRAGSMTGVVNCNVPLAVYSGSASEVEIHFHASEGVKVNHFFLGTASDVSARQFREGIPAVIFLVFSIVICLVMIIFSMLGRSYLKVGPSYYFFMVFLLCAAVWVVTDSILLDVLNFNSGVVSLASYESFMMVFIPFFMYIYYTVHSLRKLDLICIGAQSVMFVVLNILHLSGTVSLLRTDVVIQVLGLASLLVIQVQVIMEAMKVRTVSSYWTLGGFTVLLVLCLVQFAVYYSTEASRGTNLLQVGLLLFVVTQVMAFIPNIFKFMDEVQKAESYLTMAKTDPLTGLGNRRALDLHISELARNSSSMFRVGCIVCDMNDLKKTNDIYGHDVGDKLIKDFADCLTACFENRGIPFRTGGDEFYIMFSDVEVDMSAMMRRLMIGIDGTNTNTAHKISCSSGCYADFVPSGNVAAIWDIIKIADTEMYKQKKADRLRRGEQ